MRRCLIWCSGLLALAVVAGAQEVGAVKQLTVSRAADLDAAMTVEAGRRAADVIWLRLPAAQVPESQASVLRGWVAGGGTLWTDTDAIALFGLTPIAPTQRELYGHARRACDPEASKLVEGVQDIWFHLEPSGVFVAAEPAVLPLLRLADPVEPPTRPKLVAAELPYGDGRVIFRPSNVHPSRGEGRTFEANLSLSSAPSSSEVVVPLEQVRLAHDRLVQAQRLLADDPQSPEAAALLSGAAVAYRLWWAEHLSAAGRLADALTNLRALTNDLPQDPDVYLAVARYDERIGRPTEAQIAQQRAAAILGAQQRPWPGPQAPRVRVAEVGFEEAVAQAVRGALQPAQPSLQQTLAHLKHILALDSYRRGDRAAAERLWSEAFRLQPNWTLPPYGLGLVQRATADDLTLPGRQRLALYNSAADWFGRVASGQTGGAQQGVTAAAAAWAENCRYEAARVLSEPPDARADEAFVYRYDGRDPAMTQTGFLPSIQQALQSAYAAVAPYGVWLDRTEVLVAPNPVAMHAMLPARNTSPTIFADSAVSGRRIYVGGLPAGIQGQMRNCFMRVVCNALTEGGYAPPLWFELGLAAIAQDDPTAAQVALDNLRHGRPMTLAQLNAASTMGDAVAAQHALGQSELMVRALLDRVGPGAVVPFLLQLGWGTPPDEAFARISGGTQQQFLTAFVASGGRP